MASNDAGRQAGRLRRPDGDPGRRGGALIVALGVLAGFIGLAVLLTALAPPAGVPAEASAGTASPPAVPTHTVPADTMSPTAPASPTSPETPTPSLSSSTETGMSAPGQSGRNPDTAADGAKVYYNVDTDDSVFFITIDDGNYDEADAQRALSVIERNQIPVTAFLTETVLMGKNEYFERATAYGGSIQNHSMKHGSFADPATDVQWEICQAQEALKARFETEPWMIRPPYGAAAEEKRVADIAESCGINRIVMWNVLVDNNSVEYVSAPLEAGDIVLFHWSDPLLAEGLETILKLGEEQGLTPAPIEDYI